MQENLKTVTMQAGIPGTITLLQKGVFIHATSGMSVRDFMVETIGLDPDYAETRVRAIFVNGSPVDDIDGVKINDGDEVSLSGALPGISGIAMCRDTPIGAFRSDISAQSSDAVRSGDAKIYLKLFNLIAQEAGKTLLQKGVIALAEDVRAYLKEGAPEELPPENGPVLLKI
ncbi:hypothetical protein [Desulfovibrio sp. JC010]|uniref:hypothetical protein n=1 Tax=Desulfovibrio sp. JC010 TaxID=2593641 RepID=UPI0013D5C954|nr:hypothetical protein [Desulfovibrio sp. JC010]NDV25393.1 hypothetical protein [Desulfovibrio sp. JC010]